MRLRFRPVFPKDFASAFKCIRDGFLYSGTCSKQPLFLLWADLLASQSAFGACIEDIDRTLGYDLVAFVFYAFARPEFAREIREGKQPYFSNHMVDLWRKSDVPLLSAAEIAAGNAAGGLHLVKLHSGMPTELMHCPEGVPILNQTERFFHYAASGFRLRSILMEVYGEYERSIAVATHYVERSNATSSVEAKVLSRLPHQRPHVFGIDASEAERIRGTTMADLFSYKPPILGLSAIEQEQLRFALGGNTDRELATGLCMCYATIRKRWESIYLKVGRRLPEIFGDADPDFHTSYDREKRRRVLRYIDFHREELRPYKKWS